MSYENRTLPCVGKNLTPFKLSHRTLRCVGKNLTHMNTRDVQRLDVSVFLFGGQHATTISRCFCFYFSFAPDRSIARRLSHPSNPLPFSFKMPRRFLPRDIRLHLSPFRPTLVLSNVTERTNVIVYWRTKNICICLAGCL